MINKDSLLKLLQQWDQTQKEISSLKLEGSKDEALKVIDQSYIKLLGLKRYDLQTEHYLDNLLYDNTMGFEELNVLAELLKEEADLYYEFDDKIALMKYRQSLDIFDYLNQEERVFSFEREAKISAILACIKHMET